MVDCLQRGPSHAQTLREWVRAFVIDRENLLVKPFGHWNECIIDEDPTIAHEIHAHLQGIRKFVKAMDLVNVMDTPEMRAKSGLKKRIDVSTAQRWMKKLDYCWNTIRRASTLMGMSERMLWHTIKMSSCQDG